MKKPLIIINDAAARSRRIWPAIEQQLSAATINYDLYKTTGPGDATDQTRTQLNEGRETIAVVGGDGTLSEVATGFFEFDCSDVDKLPRPINANATLALLPAGTGNDFARGLRDKRTPLTFWVENLITHIREENSNNIKRIDLLYGRSDGYHRPFLCINASTMGIGGDTAKRVAAQGKFMHLFSGEFRFVYAALAALAVWRERRVRVTLDGKLLVDGPMNLAAVANALYAGGGMMLSPEASAMDGLLDVVTASGLSRSEIIRELSRIHTGGHVANPKVTIARGTIVRIETFLEKDGMLIEADGNLRGVTPVQFQVLPGALQILA